MCVHFSFSSPDSTASRDVALPAGMTLPRPVRAHRTAFTLGGLELLIDFVPAACTLPACRISLRDAVVFIRTQPRNVQEDLHGLDRLRAGRASLRTEPLNGLRTKPGNRPVI